MVRERIGHGVFLRRIVGAEVDEGFRTPVPVLTVVFQNPVANRRVGRALLTGTDGGVDLQAESVGVFFEHLFGELTRHFGDIGRVQRRVHTGCPNRGWFRHRATVFGLGQVAERAHATQHIELADPRPPRIDHRIELRGGLGQSCEHGSLSRCQFAQGAPVIDLCGRGEAVGSTP